MDRARGLFDALTAPIPEEERWARIEQLVTDREKESLWLDFKEVKPAAVPSKEAFISDKLARALSGFANTEGGVLVYGIFAKGGAKGLPDAAEKIVDIANVDAFRADLEKLCSKLVDPLVGHVVVTEVSRPGTSGGVVVVFVPASDGAPHRIVGSSAALNDRYYMRTTTNFVVMPHRMLADRFGRSASPRLELRASLSDGSPMQVEFRLSNTGRGAARRPAIQILDAHVLWQIQSGSRLPSGFQVRDERPNHGQILIEPHEDVVIYPGMERTAVRLELRMTPATGIDVTLDVALYALDTQPIRGQGQLLVAAGADWRTAPGRVVTIGDAE